MQLFDVMFYAQKMQCNVWTNRKTLILQNFYCVKICMQTLVNMSWRMLCFIHFHECEMALRIFYYLYLKYHHQYVCVCLLFYSALHLNHFYISPSKQRCSVFKCLLKVLWSKFRKTRFDERQMVNIFCIWKRIYSAKIKLCNCSFPSIVFITLNYYIICINFFFLLNWELLRGWKHLCCSLDLRFFAGYLLHVHVFVLWVKK